MLPLDLIEKIVEVYHFGSLKYAPHSWKDLENGEERYRAALMRHLTAHSYMLVMLADVVETAAMECKSLFDKYGGCYDTTIYTNLVNVAKESKALVNELNTIHTDEYSINSYADTADKLYEMALNKAKSFVRKWKEHEERANKKASRNSKVA